MAPTIVGGTAIAVFVTIPDSPQYVYSLLPSELRGTFSLGIAAIVESVVYIFYLASAVPEILEHIQAMSSLSDIIVVLWSREKPSSLEDIEKNIRDYIRLQYLVKSYNYVMGVSIMIHLACLTPAGVAGLAVSIGYHKSLHAFSTAFFLMIGLLPCSVFIALYGNVCKLQKYSGEILRRQRFAKCLAPSSGGGCGGKESSMSELVGRQLIIKKMLKTCGQLTICVNNYAKIGPMFLLGYLSAIAFNTVRLLFVLKSGVQ